MISTSATLDIVDYKTMGKQNNKLLENIKKLEEMKYHCKCGKTKEIDKSTLVYIDGLGWETKEAKCKKCQCYMQSKPTEGIPNLIRTEPSLKK